jgi:hypothetical protein
VAIAHRSEIKVYDRAGGGTPVSLPMTDIGFSVGLGGGGFLSCQIDARHASIAAAPTLLDDCVIKVGIPLDGTDTATEILAYANRARNGILWSGAGEKVRQVRSAATLWAAWSQDAILHTEANTIPQMAAPENGKRYFGAQSTIYDPSADPDYTWGTPSDSAGQQDATSGDRAGNPDGWPTELGDAYWITRPTGTDAELSRHLFVADCVVPTDCYLTVYFSSDENCAVYFAGELVLNWSASETGYEQIGTWSAWVTAGTFRVLVDKTSIVSRGGDGVDPILLAVASNTDNGGIDDILLVTNDSDWVCYAMHPVTGEAPALTPGEIMLELHSQAAARGVDTWAAITPTFTATADTDSTAWGMREERDWRIGYDRHLDMVEGLGDTGTDIEITPDLDFNAYYDRGTDVSATVVIEALVGADEITEDGVGVTGTVLYVETEDGWTPQLTNAAGLAAYGRREAALSLGNAPSIAQGVRLGQKVLDERLARPTEEWSVEFYAATGCVPFVDFGLADTVSVKIGATAVDRVVLEIGGSAPHTAAIIRWTIKTGPVL